MDQKEKLNEIRVFTEEVEGTIDSLFNPAKKIEIDPVTNEVREVMPEPVDEEAVEFELESAPSVSDAPSAEESDSVELDLTLELESEVDSSTETTAPPEEWLRKIQEHMMTLEWEVTPETIENFSHTLKEPITGLPEDIAVLPDLMVQALSILRSETDNSAGSVLPALKLGLQALEKYISDTDHETKAAHATEAAVKALKKIVSGGQDSRESESETTQAQETVQTAGAPSASDIQDHTADLVAADTPSLDLDEASLGLTPASEGMGAGTTLAEDIMEHLEVLRKSTEKIAPVEALLAGREGLEKLYKLLHGLRTDLESERKKLCQAVGVDFVPVQVEKSAVHPQQSAPAKAAGHESHVPVNEGPEQLFITHCDGVKVAFLPQEVCCHFKASSKMIKKSLKNGSFALAQLKKWPWSKISKLVSGELASLDDKALQKLTLPVKGFQGSEKASSGEKRWGIALFKNNRGAVLFVDDEPQLVAPSKDSESELITLESLSRSAA